MSKKRRGRNQKLAIRKRMAETGEGYLQASRSMGIPAGIPHNLEAKLSEVIREHMQRAEVPTGNIPTVTTALVAALLKLHPSVELRTIAEEDRDPWKFGWPIAGAVCDHLLGAEASSQVVHEVAESLASKVGPHFMLKKPYMGYEQFFGGLVFDCLFPPSDNEQIGEDSDD